MLPSTDFSSSYGGSNNCFHTTVDTTSTKQRSDDFLVAMTSLDTVTDALPPGQHPSRRPHPHPQQQQRCQQNTDNPQPLRLQQLRPLPLPKTIPSPPPRSYISMDAVGTIIGRRRPAGFRVLPAGCRGKLTCLFLVVVPTLLSLTMSAFWLAYCHLEFHRMSTRSSTFKRQLMHIGRLIVDFNSERELTVAYVTARSTESQAIAKKNLDYARRTSDLSLADLQGSWPIDSLADYGQTFRTPRLFTAVMANHRSAVKVSGSFWEELQFYTDVIDAMLGWLNDEIQSFDEFSDISRWLIAYSYLMGSLNYIGAEQTLCGAFFSVVCFSHKETYYFANFSFAGEATFRLYRQTFPVDRGDDEWRTRPHSKFFPDLDACRVEIFSNADYSGMAIDPSVCDYSRRNETSFHETDIITNDELGRLIEGFEAVFEKKLERSSIQLLMSGVMLGSIVGYLLTVHCLRISYVVYQKIKNKRIRRKQTELDLINVEDQIRDQLLLTRQNSSSTLQTNRTLNNIKHDKTNGEATAIHNTHLDYSI